MCNYEFELECRPLTPYVWSFNSGCLGFEVVLLECTRWLVSEFWRFDFKVSIDPSDPRVAKVLDELGANDKHRHTVSVSLLPVDEPFIQQYIDNTTSPEHTFKLKVDSVFKITRSGDVEFKRLLPNHKLLFHGTTPENVYPILRDGFRSALSSVSF